MPYRHVNKWILPPSLKLPSSLKLRRTSWRASDTEYTIVVNGSLVNMVNMDNLDKYYSPKGFPLRSKVIDYSLLVKSEVRSQKSEV